MGDKGGKKDKDKNKQQQLAKQKQEEQKKQDKARQRRGTEAGGRRQSQLSRSPFTRDHEFRWEIIPGATSRRPDRRAR